MQREAGTRRPGNLHNYFVPHVGSLEVCNPRLPFYDRIWFWVKYSFTYQKVHRSTGSTVMRV